ncbi:MAG: MerR family DNA-binding transcriptional regulator [Syntrophomonadaceae bacterium]|nr:MerR family DNA-binding transcriptional regulator [Syntrophomonadaceae bacterium]
MSIRLKIGDFAQLNGITVKTVLYYHKIGLLGEPERTPAGYRIYGIEELKRVVAIKRLKDLGLGLATIKGILGCAEERSSMRSILLSLEAELETQIQVLQARVDRIHKLIEEEDATLNDLSNESQAFKSFLDLLGSEAEAAYQTRCPELFNQEKQLYDLIDDLQWGVNYQETLFEIAEYFKDHPDQYQLSLDYGTQITAIANMPPDSPVIEELARSYGQYLTHLPIFNKLHAQPSNHNAAFEPVLREMFGEVLTPAQMRFIELLEQFIKLDQ